MRLQLSISEGAQNFIVIFDAGVNVIGAAAYTYEQMSLIELDFSGCGDIYQLYIKGPSPPPPQFNLSKLEFCGK